VIFLIFNDYRNVDNRILSPYYSINVNLTSQAFDRGIFKDNRVFFVKDFDYSSTNTSDIVNLLFINFWDNGSSFWNHEAFSSQKALFDEFLKASGRKVIVDNSLAFDDPQLHIPKSIPIRNITRKDMDYLYAKLKSIGVPVSLDSYDNHITKKRTDTNKVKINPWFYERCGTVDQSWVRIPCPEVLDSHLTFNKDELGVASNTFYIDSKHCITESAIDKEDDKRFFDVIHCGSNHQIVYPFRYLAKHILGLHSDITSWDEMDKYYLHMTNIRNIQNDLTKKEKDSGFNIARFVEYSDKVSHLHSTYYEQSFLKNMRASKMMIGCSSVFGYMLKKYIEAMANGTVIVGEMPIFSEHYGIVDGVHMVSSSIDELPDKIKYLKNNPEIRKSIAKNALNLVKSRYTGEAGATILLDAIEQKINS
jgi:hypothetical protein